MRCGIGERSNSRRRIFFYFNFCGMLIDASNSSTFNNFLARCVYEETRRMAKHPIYFGCLFRCRRRRRPIAWSLLCLAPKTETIFVFVVIGRLPGRIRFIRFRTDMFSKQSYYRHSSLVSLLFVRSIHVVVHIRAQ